MALIPSLTLASMLVRHYEAFVTAVFPRGVCPSNQVYYDDGYCDVHFTADGTVYIYPVKVIRHPPPHTHTTTFLTSPPSFMHMHPPRPTPTPTPTPMLTLQRWLLAGLTRTIKARAARRTVRRRRSWTGRRRMHTLLRAA